MKPRRHRRGSDRVATVVPKSLLGLSGWAGSGTVERPGRGCHPGTLRGSGRAQAVPVRFPSRTAAALKDQFGLPVAAGTVAGWVKRTALGIIAQVLPVIARRTVAAPVAPSDQTGLRKAADLLGCTQRPRPRTCSSASPPAATTTCVPSPTQPSRSTATRPTAQTARRTAHKVSGSMRTLTGTKHSPRFHSHTATDIATATASTPSTPSSRPLPVTLGFPATAHGHHQAISASKKASIQLRRRRAVIAACPELPTTLRTAAGVTRG